MLYRTSREIKVSSDWFGCVLVISSTSRRCSQNRPHSRLYSYDCTYRWLHDTLHHITLFVWYNGTRFRFSFLYAELLGFCFFQFYLNSTLSICNSGQIFREKNERKSFCLFIGKVATGSNCFGVADRWSKILDQSLYSVKRN